MERRVSGMAEVPASLWGEVCELFEGKVLPCKECRRGNPVECWHSQCGSFPFRNIARAIGNWRNPHLRTVPQSVAVEEEILDVLCGAGRPLPPFRIMLASTTSRHNKHSAIGRLVRKGLVAERWEDGRRELSVTGPGREAWNAFRHQPKGAKGNEEKQG